MRDIKLPPTGSKRRLLDAAEQLFAERGFESVSVRDVTKLAKANVAAVNYHFGSRDGLVSLVITRYLTPVNEERLLRLDALEQKWSGKSVPVEETIGAFVRPLLGVAKKAELPENTLICLVGRIFALPADALPPALGEQCRHISLRYMRALAKSLPTLTPDDLAWRMQFMVGSLVHVLTNQELLLQMSSGGSGAPSLEGILGRFIRFAAAGLREGIEVEGAAKSGAQAVFDF